MKCEDGTQTSVSTVEVGNELGADYILMLIPTMYSGFFNITAKTTVKCDIRVLSVSEGKYIYMKEVTKNGKSIAVYAGAPFFKNAYKEAIEKSLSEV